MEWLFLKSPNQEELSATICLKTNVSIWLHFPSAIWHYSSLQVFTCTVLFWMWYVVVVFKPLNDLYILTCLISCWMCFRGDCVFYVWLVMRQSLNWTNALWTAFETSECCTEYTVVMKVEWWLYVLEGLRMTTVRNNIMYKNYVWLYAVLYIL